MRKFLFEIVALVFLLIAAIHLLDKGEKSPGAMRFEKINNKLDIITLGNSHGGGYKFGSLKLKGGAFNRAGNTIFYDLQNYKYLKKHLSDSAIIILPISYFSFGLEENRVDRGTVNPFVNEFYEYLPPTSILGYSIKKDLSLRINRIQKKVQLPDLLKQLQQKKKKKKPKKKKKKVPPTIAQQIAALEKSAKSASKHHKKIFGYGEPSRNLAYLSDLISDAQKNGFRPVLITTPYYQAYNESYDKAWLKENYYRHINKISTASKTAYMDYSHDSIFSSDPDNFKNSDHLSKKGKIVFSEILFRDLVDLGILNKEAIKQPKKK